MSSDAALRSLLTCVDGPVPAWTRGPVVFGWSKGQKAIEQAAPVMQRSGAHWQAVVFTPEGESFLGAPIVGPGNRSDAERDGEALLLRHPIGSGYLIVCAGDTQAVAYKPGERRALRKAPLTDELFDIDHLTRL